MSQSYRSAATCNRHNLLNRSNCFQSSNFVSDPVLLWPPVAGQGSGTPGALSLSAVTRHPFIPPSLDRGDKWSFDLWNEYFRIIVCPITNESSSQVYRWCWWLAGGVWMLVGLVAAVPGKGTVMAAAAVARLGLVKAKGKELGQRLSCGSTQQYGAGSCCCWEGSEECLPIFLQHLTITFYQTSLDAAVRRLTVKSLIAEEFKFLSRIHLDDLSEWIFSKSECKVWFGACGESENVFMRFKLSFNDLSGPS